MRIVLGLFLLGMFGGVAQADAISFSDTDFDVTDWSMTEIADTQGNGSGVISQGLTNGNPGAYLSATYQMGPASGSTGAGVNYGYLFEPAEVDPSAGAITSIEFAFDARVFNGLDAGVTLSNPGTRFLFGIEQGGVFYGELTTTLIVAKNSGWVTLSGTGLNASNFLARDPVTGGVVAGSSPDFSTGGDPLHFGIIATNATGVGGGLLVLNWGIDNWSVTANTESSGAGPIPEPGTAVLFAAALLAAGLRWRRRAVKS